MRPAPLPPPWLREKRSRGCPWVSPASAWQTAGVCSTSHRRRRRARPSGAQPTHEPWPLCCVNIRRARGLAATRKVHCPAWQVRGKLRPARLERKSDLVSRGDTRCSQDAGPRRCCRRPAVLAYGTPRTPPLPDWCCRAVLLRSSRRCVSGVKAAAPGRLSRRLVTADGAQAWSPACARSSQGGLRCVSATLQLSHTRLL